MPHIQIKMIEGKTEEQKQKLTQEIIKATQNVIGLGDDSYSVSIEDFTASEWKEDVYPNEIMGKKDTLYKSPGYKM